MSATAERMRVERPSPQPPRKVRFHLRTAAQLMALDPPAWQLEHYLPESALTVLYGPPGSGKSFLALAWALTIARGVPWLECQTQRGPVIYVAAEGTAAL
ncbi:MAG TPA: AAA family ATPase, partial [Gemmatimonadales bacterium]|nr:AAA family ATPase [Gemmatimonadales bacterium]